MSKLDPDSSHARRRSWMGLGWAVDRYDYRHDSNGSEIQRILAANAATSSI